ncbi:protein-export chaperone SecB [Entomobacter blattae]|uniref:Protein-export protein SecB n=1 Tax=Entomobacter blattae TaxID=2762277 RepID=A0A7H1NRV4_9PROT|nr:protein-export chaperone SecB [Entomobacter blattae]QNT78514.1 Protein-export protein SecB [Entomobacter blattae]
MPNSEKNNTKPDHTKAESVEDKKTKTNAQKGTKDTPQAEDQPQGAPALPLSINLQYVKDLSFEVPAGAEIFASLKTNPTIAINIDVQVSRLQETPMVFEVSLLLKTEANEAPEKEGGQPGRTVFLLELTYCAIVTLNNVANDMIEPILLVEVPRLIFPYARNILSDLTRDGGFPPVVLQPVDFVSLWQNKRNQLQQQPAAGQA